MTILGETNPVRKNELREKTATYLSRAEELQDEVSM